MATNMMNETEERIKKYGLRKIAPGDEHRMFFCTVAKKLCPGSKCLKHRHGCCEEDAGT